mmetsp:Transcript_4203/g.14003  ORF Transcript_4203/g.14003 Transcript_4203/m.14003 type:complete len:270 (+) Transcript_4203:714-1523(+)
MYVSRSNTAREVHFLVLAGVTQICPEMGHRRDKMALSSTIMSSSSSPAPAPPSARSTKARAAGNPAGAGTSPLTWSKLLLFAIRITSENDRRSAHDMNKEFCPTASSASGTSTTGSLPALPMAFPGFRYITGSGAWFTRKVAVNGQCSRAITGSSINTQLICSWYSRFCGACCFASFCNKKYCSAVNTNGLCKLCDAPFCLVIRVGDITTPGVETSFGTSAAAQNGSHARTLAQTPGSGVFSARAAAGGAGPGWSLGRFSPLTGFAPLQ